MIGKTCVFDSYEGNSDVVVFAAPRPSDYEEWRAAKKAAFANGTRCIVKEVDPEGEAKVQILDTDYVGWVLTDDLNVVA